MGIKNKKNQRRVRKKAKNDQYVVGIKKIIVITDKVE